MNNMSKYIIFTDHLFSYTLFEKSEGSGWKIYCLLVILVACRNKGRTVRYRNCIACYSVMKTKTLKLG